MDEDWALVNWSIISAGCSFVKIELAVTLVQRAETCVSCPVLLLFYKDDIPVIHRGHWHFGNAFCLGALIYSKTFM